MRKLEERVGELIRAEREAGRLTTKGGDPESKVGIPTLEAVGISKQDAADFVAMAEHADVVEDVIANSDDANVCASSGTVIVHVSSRRITTSSFRA